MGKYTRKYGIVGIGEGKQKQKAEAIKQGLLSVKQVQGTTGVITVQPDGGARIKESAFVLVDGMPQKV